MLKTIIAHCHDSRVVYGCKYPGTMTDERLSILDHTEYVSNKLIKFASIFYRDNSPQNV